MGERTPHLDAQARGVLVRPHRRAHGARTSSRSVLEGVAYSLRDCLDLLVAMGVPVEEIRARAAAARSPLWRQIQADVFGREVATVNAAEGPAYGAALLAGRGHRQLEDGAGGVRGQHRGHEPASRPTRRARRSTRAGTASTARSTRGCARCTRRSRGEGRPSGAAAVTSSVAAGGSGVPGESPCAADRPPCARATGSGCCA